MNDCPYCKTLCLYDFNQPCCVARFLKTHGRDRAKRWWMRFKKEKGVEFMELVREIVEAK